MLFGRTKTTMIDAGETVAHLRENRRSQRIGWAEREDAEGGPAVQGPEQQQERGRVARPPPTPAGAPRGIPPRSPR